MFDPKCTKPRIERVDAILNSLAMENRFPTLNMDLTLMHDEPIVLSKQDAAAPTRTKLRTEMLDASSVWLPMDILSENLEKLLMETELAAFTASQTDSFQTDPNFEIPCTDN
jgi:hypothetical protein